MRTHTYTYHGRRKRRTCGSSAFFTFPFIRMSSNRRNNKKRQSRKKSGSESLTMRPGRLGQLILPERFRTVLESNLAFYIPATNIAVAGNYMDVLVNSFYHPFQTTYVVSTAVNTYSMHGSYVNGFSSTQNPMGYSTFAALYTLYKVMSYELVVTCQPQNTGDTVALCIFPIGNEEIPSATAANVNLQVFEGQPKFRSVVCANGVAAKFNTLSIRQPVHDLLGKRPSQWMDTDGTALGAQPATDAGYCGIFIQGLDGASNTSPIVVSVKLRQWIEFTDLVQQVS